MTQFSFLIVIVRMLPSQSSGVPEKAFTDFRGSPASMHDVRNEMN